MATRERPSGRLLVFPTPQLFRLDTDLSESQDLSPQHPERVATLQRALENWSKEVNAAPLGR